MGTKNEDLIPGGFGVECYHYGLRRARVVKVNRRTCDVAGRFKDGRPWSKRMSVRELELNPLTADSVCSWWLGRYTAHDGTMRELVQQQRAYGYVPTLRCDTALDVLVADWYDRTARHLFGDEARRCHRIGKAKGR